MSFDRNALEGIRTEADRLSVEWQVLAAVAEVESGGRPLWDGLCPIRIEGHYFYNRLKRPKRDEAVAGKLASPNAGAVKNPKNMACCRSRYSGKFSQNNPRRICRIPPPLVPRLVGIDHAKTLGVSLRQQPAAPGHYVLLNMAAPSG